MAKEWPSSPFHYGSHVTVPPFTPQMRELSAVSLRQTRGGFCTGQNVCEDLEGAGDPRLVARLLLLPRFGGDGVSVRRHAGGRVPGGQVGSRPRRGLGEKGGGEGNGDQSRASGAAGEQQPANATVQYPNRLAAARAAGRALPSLCSGCT